MLGGNIEVRVGNTTLSGRKGNGRAELASLNDDGGGSSGSEEVVAVGLGDSKGNVDISHLLDVEGHITNSRSETSHINTVNVFGTEEVQGQEGIGSRLGRDASLGVVNEEQAVLGALQVEDGFGNLVSWHVEASEGGSQNSVVNVAHLQHY